jgi:hypothetical protein
MLTSEVFSPALRVASVQINVQYCGSLSCKHVRCNESGVVDCPDLGASKKKRRRGLGGLTGPSGAGIAKSIQVGPHGPVRKHLDHIRVSYTVACKRNGSFAIAQDFQPHLPPTLHISVRTVLVFDFFFCETYLFLT